jgi:flagellar hook-basal body complex protein FliE
MTTPSIAARAYGALAGLPTPGGGAAGAGAGGGTSFVDLLRQTATDFTRQGQRTDQQIGAMAAGKADLVDVVTAVAETEVAIETLVSVRDRVIQSYEEIMRMQI